MLYQAQEKFNQMVNQAAGENSIPAALVKAVLANESRFNPGATGDQGNAHGIGQMWLRTARGLGYTGPAGDPNAGTGLYDPRTAINLTAKYLAQQMRRYGNIPAALSAYNAGHSMIPAAGPEKIPHLGNREYVRKGVIHYNYFLNALSEQNARMALTNKIWLGIAVAGAGAIGLLTIAAIGLFIFIVWRS